MATKKTTAVETVEVEQAERTETKFSKEQILASARFVNRRDAVNALLDDNEQYTMTQVDSIINDFMKGKVK